ncbi:MAG: GGDEF domain-containing protein [Acholeplasmataceae bacterium]|nr:GGDEF domain-containing protein [Acholeplasmataceae bacterium]
MTRLDLFTALIILSLTSLVFVMYIYKIINTSKGKFKGLGYIMYGFLGYALGTFLITFRDFIPFNIYLSVILGNFISIYGAMNLTFGIKKLFGYHESIKIYTVFLLLVFSATYYFAVIDDNISARIIVMSFAIAILFFHTALAIYSRIKSENKNYLYSLIYIMIIFSAVFIARMILAFINYYQIGDFLSYHIDTIFQIAITLALFTVFIDIIVIINKILFNEIENKLEENQDLVSKLELITKVDYLTGLYNRKSLEEKANLLIEECTKEGKSFQYIFIDLDSFKDVNDLYGHHFGDQVLIHFGELLKNKAKYVYRFGGDEFIIILEDALVNAEDLIEAIKNQCLLCENQFAFQPVFSYGIHRWQAGETYTDLMNTTDLMMYQNKKDSKVTTT